MPRARSRPAPALPALLGLAVAACSSPGTPQAFDAQMAGFVGRPEAEVVASLGLPNRTYDADGRRLLQYEFATPSPGPAVYPSVGLGFGGFGWGSGVGVGTGLGLGFGPFAAPPAGCVLVFESREGRVSGFQRNGPGCVTPAA